MKKILLFFILVSNFAFCQSFEKLDSLQFANTVEQFVKDTGKEFSLDSYEKHPTKQKYLLYKNAQQEGFLVTYDSYYDGKNTALEIQGIKKFNIKSLSGKFLTIFPIWNKYVDPNISKEKLSSEKLTVKDVGNTTWRLEGYNDNTWVIKTSKREPKQKFENITILFSKNKNNYIFKKDIEQSIRKQVEADFKTDPDGDYTAYYDIFYLDDKPSKINLKARKKEEKQNILKSIF